MKHRLDVVAVGDQFRAQLEQFTELGGKQGAVDAVLAKPARLLGLQVSRDVRDQIGVTVSVGLSYNKFLAKLASDLDKPNGYSVIGRGEAQTFLGPLPITKINGVGAATARRLRAAGIETIADLRARPEEELG